MNRTYIRKKLMIVFVTAIICMSGLIGRLSYLMLYKAEYYSEKAETLHERERSIKAKRGKIIDRMGVVLAENKSVCTISVIHNQVKEKEKVIEVLSDILQIDEKEIRKKVEKVSAREKIKSNVEKEIGDRIRSYDLQGVKVDEDYKRYYPYEELASKVLGFTGADNQGIVGLEVKYDKWLKGIDGKIQTTTDARGVEIEEQTEERIEPISGKTLQLTLDYNIQKYSHQAAEKVAREKEADGVGVIVMNPSNGEIYACVNIPEFNLNQPFSLEQPVKNEKEVQKALNQKWRNQSINDTYEPGSIFKIFTAAAALEAKLVKEEDRFYCPGYKIVEDRRIRCAKVQGHGAESFVEGVQNSCNPVFIEVGERLGVERFFEYLEQFQIRNKTGVDLPGEASTIIHKKKNVGQVELATMAFGQSFQITPFQMAVVVSSVINGGVRITPHFAKAVYGKNGEVEKEFQYEVGKRVISEETSKRMCTILEAVVAQGGGNKAQVEGYRIGGKTATSQTLPRSANQYISAFIGFAPAEAPQVLAMVIIYHPKGVYYGGTIAAPVVKDIFQNILPYMGIEKGNKGGNLLKNQ